jgi:hypothetical protein
LFVKTIHPQKVRHIVEQRNIENDLDYVDRRVSATAAVVAAAHGLRSGVDLRIYRW